MDCEQTRDLRVRKIRQQQQKRKESRVDNVSWHRDATHN